MSFHLLVFILVAMSNQTNRSSQTHQSTQKDWHIYISHDCCNDFTWGNDEVSTKDNLAEMLRAHLDVMQATDNAPPDERDHYTSTTFIEIVSFLQKYPQRKAEVVQRAKEGRLTMSPWLTNTLWGSMTPEATLRSMSAARRLEIETGAPINHGNHSEMPSLPLGVVPLLAGAGLEWLVVPWLLFDTTWGTSTNPPPPIFAYVGPDGSRLTMIFDHYTCLEALYIQGLKILQEPERIPKWLKRFESFEHYPIKAIFAAGTHHDLFPEKRLELIPLNNKMKELSDDPNVPSKLVNASLTRFVIEQGRAVEAKLPIEKLSFGISWEAWPVALAGIMATARLAEHRYYDAETLLAIALLSKPAEWDYTEAARQRADDVLAFLGEHAWNGMDARSHRINQRLRQSWVNELEVLGETLEHRSSQALLKEEEGQYTLFNPLGHSRKGIASVPQELIRSVSQNWVPFTQQEVCDNGEWTRVFVTPDVPAFGFQSFHSSNPTPMPPIGKATNTTISNDFFTLRLDDKRPGLSSLIHTPSGTELRTGTRNIGETVWYAGREIPLTVESRELTTHGSVLTRLEQTSSAPGLHLTTLVTAYHHFDYLDVEIRIRKTAFHKLERVCQVFPMGKADAVPLAQTPGAFLRVAETPKGDFYHASDLNRLALSGFVQIEHSAGLCSVATLESFLLRPDLEPLSIECLGNDQNPPEVSHDQGGHRDFRFRYRLRFDPQDTPLVQTAQWAANFARPLVVLPGRATPQPIHIEADATRVAVQCLKPSLEKRGLILRFWECTGSSEPVNIKVAGFEKIYRTDLLERDKEEIRINKGEIQVPVSGWGFGAVRLIPNN